VGEHCRRGRHRRLGSERYRLPACGCSSRAVRSA